MCQRLRVVASQPRAGRGTSGVYADDDVHDVPSLRARAGRSAASSDRSVAAAPASTGHTTSAGSWSAGGVPGGNTRPILLRGVPETPSSQLPTPITTRGTAVARPLAATPATMTVSPGR